MTKADKREKLKGNLNQKHKSYASCLVTTIKNLNRRPVKELRIPVFSFSRTQESAQYKSNILAAFDGNLDKAIKTQNGSPLDYGS